MQGRGSSWKDAISDVVFDKAYGTYGGKADNSYDAAGSVIKGLKLVILW